MPLCDLGNAGRRLKRGEASMSKWSLIVVPVLAAVFSKPLYAGMRQCRNYVEWDGGMRILATTESPAVGQLVNCREGVRPDHLIGILQSACPDAGRLVETRSVTQFRIDQTIDRGFNLASIAGKSIGLNASEERHLDITIERGQEDRLDIERAVQCFKRMPYAGQEDVTHYQNAEIVTEVLSGSFTVTLSKKQSAGVGAKLASGTAHRNKPGYFSNSNGNVAFLSKPIEDIFRLFWFDDPDLTFQSTETVNLATLHGSGAQDRFWEVAPRQGNESGVIVIPDHWTASGNSVATLYFVRTVRCSPSNVITIRDERTGNSTTLTIRALETDISLAKSLYRKTKTTRRQPPALRSVLDLLDARESKDWEKVLLFHAQALRYDSRLGKDGVLNALFREATKGALLPSTASLGLQKLYTFSRKEILRDTAQFGTTEWGHRPKKIAKVPDGIVQILPTLSEESFAKDVILTDTVIQSAAWHNVDLRNYLTQYGLLAQKK